MSRDIYQIIHKNRGGLFFMAGGALSGFLMALSAWPVGQTGVFFFSGLLRFGREAGRAYVNLFNLIALLAVLVWQRQELTGNMPWMLQMFVLVLLVSAVAVGVRSRCRMGAWVGAAIWLLLVLYAVTGAFCSLQLPFWVGGILAGVVAGLTGSPAAAALPLCGAFSPELGKYVCLAAFCGLPISVWQTISEKNRRLMDLRVVLYYTAGMALGFWGLIALARLKYAWSVALICICAIFIYLKLREITIFTGKEKADETK